MFIVLRWFFVALLAVSGGAKLLDLTGFFAVVETFKVLPAATIPAAALGLALLEVSLAIWLASAKTAKACQVPAAFVLALHIAYFAWLALAYGRGLTILNCGCFGAFWARPLTAMTLVEDAALSFLAAILLLSHVSSARKK